MFGLAEVIFELEKLGSTNIIELKFDQAARYTSAVQPWEEGTRAVSWDEPANVGDKKDFPLYNILCEL